MSRRSSTLVFIVLSFGAVVLGGCSNGATCVPGATAACLCGPSTAGVQTCASTGTYGTCSCPGSDAGMTPDLGTPTDSGSAVDLGTPPTDSGPADDLGTPTDSGPADDLGTPPTDSGPPTDGGPPSCPSPLTMCGSSCVDTATDEANCGGCAGGTHTCAAGSYCVSGVCQPVASCPPPFVMCSPDCIDPRTDAAHCGASGSCTGATAGTVCGGACLGGRCVYESCADVLAAGASTGNGLYLIDIDGTGTTPPQLLYCDMTTDGGGWTLVYKIRNDVPDISDPWWGMVDVGSGSTFPTAPTVLPSGTHFEGPTRDVRNVFFNRTAITGMTFRATMITPAGTTLLDVALRDASAPTGMAASGALYTPSSTCGGFATVNGRVLASRAPVPFAVGEMVYDCYFMSSGSDIDSVRNATSGNAPVMGDSSISGYSASYANTTTLLWLRQL